MNDVVNKHRNKLRDIITVRKKEIFPYKDILNRSLRSKVVYKGSCYDCDDSYIAKTKLRGTLQSADE